MLPNAYELPAAVLLVLTGVLTCFAGYRLFKIVLAVYGFILGALMGSSVMGASNTLAMVGAALVGGAAGAIILLFAYFVGVALVGAGLAALATHLAWTQIWAMDPPAAAIILLSIFGAVVAMLLQRYVIIVGTAFGGAWTIILGTMALLNSGVKLSSAPEAWILYPLSPAPGQRWVPVAWVVLGLVGTLVQFGITGKKKR